MSPRPLPPYAHIPGVTPHPLRDPAGHSYRESDSSAPDTSPSPPAPLTWAGLPAHSEFQWAVQLFNAGYYWESHEAWESLWHAAGRKGAIADFLKGLIKLAAAGVKLREHNLVGVERHARRALELFEEVQRGMTCSGSSDESVAFRSAKGRSFAERKTTLVEASNLTSEEACTQLHLPELIEIADQLVHQPPPLPSDRTGQPVVTLPRLAYC